MISSQNIKYFSNASLLFALKICAVFWKNKILPQLAIGYRVIKMPQGLEITGTKILGFAWVLYRQRNQRVEKIVVVECLEIQIMVLK